MGLLNTINQALGDLPEKIANRLREIAGDDSVFDKIGTESHGQWANYDQDKEGNDEPDVLKETLKKSRALADIGGVLGIGSFGIPHKLLSGAATVASGIGTIFGRTDFTPPKLPPPPGPPDPLAGMNSGSTGNPFHWVPPPPVDPLSGMNSGTTGKAGTAAIPPPPADPWWHLPLASEANKRIPPPPASPPATAVPPSAPPPPAISSTQGQPQGANGPSNEELIEALKNLTEAIKGMQGGMPEKRQRGVRGLPATVAKGVKTGKSPGSVLKSAGKGVIMDFLADAAEVAVGVVAGL